MEILDSGRRLATRGINETRAIATIARTGIVRPSAALHGPQMLRAWEHYGIAGAAITLAAAAHGDRTALVDERGELTFTELDRRSNAVANGLRDLGLRGGDVVGVLCRNHRGVLDAQFGTAKVGTRTVLLNTDFSAPQLREVCEREGVRLLIYDEDVPAASGDYAPDLGRVVAWRPDHGSTARSSDADLETLIADGSPRRPPKPEAKAHLVLLTSGTTGTPKGASRDAVLSLAVPGGFLSKIPLRGRRSMLVCSPIFHAWGMANANAAIAFGSTLIVHRRFDPMTVLDALERHHCDAMATVPILLARLLALGDDEIRARHLSLRIIALSGSALSAELGTHALDVFGEVVYNLYGSTEVAYAAIATPADLRAAPGSVGRPPYGTTVKLLDADGRPVPNGQQGRIFVGNGAQFAGYTGGGSKQVIDGLMSSGDTGYFDSRGYLFVSGREDDMIVSGGENVFPGEVEELLAAHPGIADAAVVGIADAEFGQRLRAYVVVAGPDAPDEAAIQSYVRENLARYKVPREVRFLDELPRNPAGKLMRRELPDYPG